MTLSLKKYENMTAQALCTDPFFQEWVFHPLGPHREFFLHLLIGHSPTHGQMQIAQAYLLKYSKECTLISKMIEQYTVMKGALAKEACTQECFNITQDYTNCIIATLEEYEFQSDAREIHFFKVIKPLFIAEREYYSLLHHTELFSESSGDGRFWERQLAKLDKFKKEKSLFVKAYTSGSSYYDERWYLRMEFRDKTLHDETVGAYLGMVRYVEYVNFRLLAKHDG